MISESSLDLLEFKKLLGVVSGFASSEASRPAVLDIAPLRDRNEITQRFALVGDIRRMSQTGSPLGLSRFPDIARLFAELRPEGAVLEPGDLSGFIPVLEVMSDVAARLRERDDIPALREFTAPLTGFPDMLRALKRSIDSEGNILDTASPTLAGLRERTRKQEGRIRNRLEEMVRDESVSVFLQDDFITTRSGRWVIPVRMDSKGQVQGVVHDVSRSGETAFVEPLAIISLANELENLTAEQKAEEIRILRSVCSGIRAVAGEMEAQYELLIRLDVLNCIAGFADMMHMEIPQVSDSGLISLANARHPLLMLAFGKRGDGSDVVPLDVTLGGDSTVMVITGSNAGGKTIAIKTIGLLQIMALSGMPVTADSSSSFPVIHDLLMDIGDEQSIESSLSTFSAHVSNISKILKKAGSEALVLIDELGTGTDPDEGAALACAVLKELRTGGALTFATTHLTDIKGFVHRTDGMLNASMEFDATTLTPLYRLRVGEPGQSHALDIARRYGLPESIIDSAKGLLGGIRVDFDNMIADLNEKRKRYEKELEDLDRLRAEAEEKNRDLERLISEAEARKKETLSEAYKEASGIIAGIKRELHELLKEAKEKGRARAREAVRQAEEKQEQVSRKLRECEGETEAPSIDEIMEGDVVYVRSLGGDAPVVDINLKHNRLRVSAGGKEVEVPASDIGYKRGRAVEAAKRGAPSVSKKEMSESSAASASINLVGQRVDEALSKLEPFLNHASLAGFNEVVIIHGIGKGLLAKAVREHLEGHPLIRSFRKGDPSEGGAGVTVATLV